jgi:HEAT repeat protein
VVLVTLVENPTAIVGALRENGRRQPIADLDHWPTLVRFAATALVDRTGPRAAVAARMGKSKGNFHGALLGRTGQADETPPKRFCRDLQQAISVLEGRSGHGTWPTLTSLYEELEENIDPDPGIRVPAAWFVDLCESGPVRSSEEAFVRGEALRDMVAMTRTQEERAQLLSGRTLDHARRTVMDLLAITGGAPRRGVPATNLLARLGAVALPEVENEIWQSPVGFRSIRVLGRMLWRAELCRRGHDDGDLCSAADCDLLDAIEAILVSIDERPPLDPYPARSFYVEALRWAPPDWDWVPAKLACRARNPNRPVRERMYAAMLANERRYPQIDALIKQLRDEGHDTGEDGLQYAAAVLDQVRAGAAPNSWLGPGAQVPPDGLHRWPPDRPEPRYVDEVVAALDGMNGATLPASVRAGTKTLVAEALLTLDGTRRRRACDVLGVARLADPAATAISRLVRDREGPPRWLREHAAFILGYLQQPAALPALTDVVDDAADHPTVVHAAAWGIGDICGQRPRWEHRHDVPVDALSSIAQCKPEPAQWAAIYTLAVTRQPAAQPTLRKLLEQSERGPLSRALARWGIWLFEADNLRGRLDDVVRIPSSRTLLHG